MPKVNVYLPDDLAEQVRHHGLPISTICQAALSKEIERVQTKDQFDLEEITVWVGNKQTGDQWEETFVGRWLVEPDPDDTRTGEEGYDLGAYWGVAFTRRGRIAVYTAHCNELWPGHLDDYDDLQAAAANEVPADILAQAATALAVEQGTPLLRDI